MYSEERAGVSGAPNGEQRRAVLRRLIAEARPYFPKLAISFVLGAIAGLGPLAYPKAFEIVIGRVVNAGGHDMSILFEVLAALLIVNLVANAASYGQSYLSAWSGQRLIASLRVRLFERVMRLPLAEFDKWRPGEFLTRFTNDLALMTDAASLSLPQLFQTLVTFIGAVGNMLYTDWLLTLVLFVFAPVVNYVVAAFTRLISSGTSHAQARVADLSSNLTESLAAERVIKAFGREPYEVQRFADTNERFFGAYMKLTQLGQTQTPVVAMVITIAILAIIAFSVREVLVGRMRSEQLFNFWTSVVIAINPLNRFATYIADLSKGIVGAARVFEVLDLPVERDQTPPKVTASHIDGALRFERVSFAYEQADGPALRDLTFEIAAGEVVALVGPSGSGKTTIANLIPRFYLPQTGRITLDGIELGDLGLVQLRTAIGIVPQEALLFSGTVAENIRYGRLDASSAEVERAAREANAEEFILDLPLGYQTLVGERGSRLSGGQRQRVSIARAILRDPRILILDEATSALDSHSEKLIEAALDTLLRGRTTIIIAHRLSTVRRASKILYIEEGRVRETGSHEDLLARGGRYASLHATQALG